MAEEDMWERLENLKNIRDLVEEFKKEIKKEEIWWVKKKKEKQRAVEVELNLEADKFKKGDLPEIYMAKILYRWNDKKFEEKYLKKLERN